MAEVNGAMSAPEQNHVSADDLADLRKQVEEGKRQTEAANKAREAAEAKVRTQSDVVARRTTDAVTATDNQLAAQKQAAENAISAATSSLAQAKRDFEAAMNDGKWTDAAEAQDAVAAARFKLEQAQDWKANVERNEANWKTKRETYTAEPEKSADPLANFSPKARDWIERHPQFMSDTKYRNRVNAAHFKALANDYTEYSDDYFAFVEKEIGERKDAKTDPGPNEEPGAEVVTEPEPTRQRTGASTAAAPSRSSANSGTRRETNSGTLTPSQMMSAKISFPDEYRKDPKEAYRLYAENLVALQREGKLN